MNLDFYKNFLTVAECGNITVAAARLNLAQPALSAQLKLLEQHYGTRLIEARRGRRQIRLTEAGVDFLRRAREICHAEASLALDLEAYSSRSGGTLRLAVSPGVAESFIAQFLLPFARRYPEVTLQLQEEIVTAQLADIKKGRIDIAYANAPLPEADSLSCRHLATEYFFVVRSQTDELPQPFPPGQPVRLEALRGQPLACNHGNVALLSKLCHDRGFAPQLRFVSSTGHAAVSFAASGLAVGVLPDSCCRALPPGLVRAPLAEPALSYSQTLLWPRDRTLPPAAKNFLAMTEYTSNCFTPSTE